MVQKHQSQQQQQQSQQHRIYIVQIRKGGEPEQEVSCKVSQPKGSAGRRVMYYYQDHGNGGGKSGKLAQSRALGSRRLLSLLMVAIIFVVTLFVAPLSFLSFVHTDDGGAAAAAATAARSGAVQLTGPCSAVRNGSICCDRSSERADICFAKGDLRMHSASASFLLVSGNNSTAAEEERIRPYTRKWEANVMATIDEVRLRRVAPGGAGESAPRCDVVHDVPAVVFSTGGYTGNVYHEFNDGILPLFVTAGHLRRRVVFVILEYHDWWVTKYGDVVSRLSAFPPVDFSADRRVHCFPEVIAGLRIHGELTVDPARTPEGRGIDDFRWLLDDAYRGRIQFLEEQEQRAARKHRRRRGATALPLPPPRRTTATAHQLQEDRRPRLTIVSRTGSRVIENEAEVAAMAAAVGFDVRVIRPDRTTELCKIYRELNASDAMVGVHGAAMTHFLFMRPGKVFIQVVPLGTDWAAGAYYGEPAARLGLRYVGYKILPEESSLSREYPAGDPVLVDPAAVSQRGWDVTKKVYLDRQNVRLDLKRFRGELVRAHQYLVAGRRTKLPRASV